MDERNFFDRLDRVSSWRKRELSELALGMPDMENKLTRHALMRGCVVICCAHWEGFVRDASKLFVTFLDGQELGVSQLNKNFVALLKPEGKERKFEPAWRELWRNSPGNIKPNQLRKITWQLGFDYEPFITKERLIADLVDRRNAIAHGEKTGVGEDEYIAKIQDVRNLLSSFETEVVRSVRERRYLDTASIRG